MLYTTFLNILQFFVNYTLDKTRDKKKTEKKGRALHTITEKFLKSYL